MPENLALIVLIIIPIIEGYLRVKKLKSRLDKLIKGYKYITDLNNRNRILKFLGLLLVRIKYILIRILKILHLKFSFIKSNYYLKQNKNLARLVKDNFFNSYLPSCVIAKPKTLPVIVYKGSNNNKINSLSQYQKRTSLLWLRHSTKNRRSFSVLAGGSLCNTVRNVERLPVLFGTKSRPYSTTSDDDSYDDSMRNDADLLEESRTKSLETSRQTQEMLKKKYMLNGSTS